MKIGLLGRYLSGKSSIVSILGTDMKLSEKITKYLPTLEEIIIKFKDVTDIGDANNLKSIFEGLLERSAL